MLYAESPPNFLICIAPRKLLPSRQDTGRVFTGESNWPKRKELQTLTS